MSNYLHKGLDQPLNNSINNQIRGWYIYKYYINNQLVYVGKALNPYNRLLQHRSEQDRYNQVDFIEVLECPTQIDMDILEIYFINLFNPPWNIASKDKGLPTYEVNYSGSFIGYSISEFQKTFGPKLSSNKGFRGFKDPETVQREKEEYDKWFNSLTKLNTIDKKTLCEMYFSEEHYFAYGDYLVQFKNEQYEQYVTQNPEIKNMFDSLFTAIQSDPDLNEITLNSDLCGFSKLKENDFEVKKINKTDPTRKTRGYIWTPSLLFLKIKGKKYSSSGDIICTMEYYDEFSQVTFIIRDILNTDIN